MFDRSLISTFRFVRRAFDPGSGCAQLVYAFDDGPELVETITIPGGPFTLDAHHERAVQQALRLMHLICGVSYYKAAVPPAIIVEGEPLDVATAALLDTIYLHGLSEFAYRNGLDLRGRIRFPSTATTAPAAPNLNLRDHALTAIGGGKDSLVSIDTLRTAGVEQTLTWVGNACPCSTSIASSHRNYSTTTARARGTGISP